MRDDEGLAGSHTAKVDDGRCSTVHVHFGRCTVSLCIYLAFYCRFWLLLLLMGVIGDFLFWPGWRGWERRKALVVSVCMTGKRIFYLCVRLTWNLSPFFLAVSAVSDVLSTNEMNGFGNKSHLSCPTWLTLEVRAWVGGFPFDGDWPPFCLRKKYLICGSSGIL